MGITGLWAHLKGQGRNCVQTLEGEELVRRGFSGLQKPPTPRELDVEDPFPTAQLHQNEEQARAVSLLDFAAALE